MPARLLYALRRSIGLRMALRSAKMQLLRMIRGLRYVDRTFYCTFRSRISRDLRACPYSFVGDSCYICPKVSIGAYSMLASQVAIVGADHIMDVPGTAMCFSGRPHMPKTQIGRDCWIGYRAVIAAGVTIGDGAVVGAGAVVTKDVPPYTVVAGVPARSIRSRFKSEADVALHRSFLDAPPVPGRLCDPKEFGDMTEEGETQSCSVNASQPRI